MPNILVKIPQGTFSTETKALLAKKINQAAVTAEQIPDDITKQVVNWITIDEVATGCFTCGGQDLTNQVIPCIVIVYVPAGVLESETRSVYVALIHAAFESSLPPDETRRLATSVILSDVAEGVWGGNGTVLHLADLAKIAGFKHLQHLDKLT